MGGARERGQGHRKVIHQRLCPPEGPQRGRVVEGPWQSLPCARLQRRTKEAAFLCRALGASQDESSEAPPCGAAAGVQSPQNRTRRPALQLLLLGSGSRLLTSPPRPRPAAVLASSTRGHTATVTGEGEGTGLAPLRNARGMSVRKQGRPQPPHGPPPPASLSVHLQTPRTTPAPNTHALLRALVHLEESHSTFAERLHRAHTFPCKNTESREGRVLERLSPRSCLGGDPNEPHTVSSPCL